MKYSDLGFAGLGPQEVEASRAVHGENKVERKQTSPLLLYVKDAVKEPMVLLLVAASSIYFIHGELGEGIFLVIAIILISSISLYQESRSRNALEALKSLTQPKSKVLRQGFQPTR
jgi:Ca2+-transporting ATPase